MSSLGVTVLQKDDSLQRAIMQVMSGWQQSRSDDRTRAQQADQFAATNANDVARTKSLVDTNAATLAGASDDRITGAANDIVKGIKASLDQLHKEGATPEKITETTLKALQNFESTPGEPPEFGKLKFGVRSRLIADITGMPDTPGAQTQRNSLETTAKATARANAGGQSPSDLNVVNQAAFNAQLTQPAFEHQASVEQGPGAVKARVAIADKRAESADNAADNRTTIQATGMQNASAEKIARLRDQNDRDIAAMKAAGGGTAEAENAEQKQKRLLRIKASVDDLMGDVNASTVGMLGSMFAKVGSTPAADFAADLTKLKGNIAFKELQEIRDASKTGGALGSIAVRELEMLESTLGALDTKQSPTNFKKNLALVGVDIADSLDRWHSAKGAGGGTTSRAGTWQSQDGLTWRKGADGRNEIVP